MAEVVCLSGCERYIVYGVRWCLLTVLCPSAVFMLAVLPVQRRPDRAFQSRGQRLRLLRHQGRRVHRQDRHAQGGGVPAEVAPWLLHGE